MNQLKLKFLECPQQCTIYALCQAKNYWNKDTFLTRSVYISAIASQVVWSETVISYFNKNYLL